MGAQAALTVRPVAAEVAAQALAGMAPMDPRGMVGEGDIAAMCEAGECFAIDGEASAVYVLTVRNGCAWVQAAKGSGPVDLSAVLDAAISAQAQAHGLDALGCQTARPGLVRKLQRLGWRVSGWVLRKELT